jgi:hypothetical protein
VKKQTKNGAGTRAAKTITTTKANRKAAINTEGMKSIFMKWIDEDNNLDHDYHRDSKGNLFLSLLGRRGGKFINTTEPISEGDALRDWIETFSPDCWKERLLRCVQRGPV